jgi:hypothetical protein
MNAASAGARLIWTSDEEIEVATAGRAAELTPMAATTAARIAALLATGPAAERGDVA